MDPLLLTVHQVERLPSGRLQLRTDKYATCNVSSDFKGEVRKGSVIRVTRYVINAVQGEDVLIALALEEEVISTSLTDEQKRRAEANKLAAKKKRRRDDSHLARCLRVGAMTECSGAAGTGKSMLSATVGAMALALDPTASVLYIETSGSHCTRRAVRVASARGVDDAKKRVLRTAAMDLPRLVDALTRQVQLCAASRRVGLIVVDCYADVVHRRADLNAVITALKKCIATTSCPLFLTNRVAADFDAGGVRPCHDGAMAKLATLRFSLSGRRDDRTLSVGDKQAQFLITDAGVSPKGDVERLL